MQNTALHTLRSIMSAKCTMMGDELYRPFTLGRLGLPDRLPFSDCQVKAILQVDAGGSGEPMSEYYSDAIDKANNGDLHGMQGEWTK